MKTVKLTLSALAVILASSSLYAFEPYVSGSGGVSTLSGRESGSVAEVRGGAKNHHWDFSYGYLRNETDSLVLNTLNLEAYSVIPIVSGLHAKLGLGGGFTVPNQDGPKRFDNGLSGVFGGGFGYSIARNLSLGLNAKYFVFKTDSQTTSKITETEAVFQNGVQIGTVETETPMTTDSSENLNSLNLTLALTYWF